MGQSYMPKWAQKIENSYLPVKYDVCLHRNYIVRARFNPGDLNWDFRPFKRTDVPPRFWALVCFNLIVLSPLKNQSAQVTWTMLKRYNNFASSIYIEPLVDFFWLSSTKNNICVPVLIGEF